MPLSNYGELKASIADYLNRDNLVSQIPDFIRLAERKIFRGKRGIQGEDIPGYRARENETELLFDKILENPLTNLLALPADYLEVLTLLADDQPMTRVSLTQIQAEFAQHTKVGRPFRFARRLGEIIFAPFPQEGVIYEMLYYADLSGTLVQDDDTNKVLTANPDVYLYGSLVEAEPFVRDDKLAEMMGVWRGLWTDSMMQVASQTAEEDRSGSVNVINSAFGGFPGTGFRNDEASSGNA